MSIACALSVLPLLFCRPSHLLLLCPLLEPVCCFCFPAVLFVVMFCLFCWFLFSHPFSVKDSLVMWCIHFFLLFLLVPVPFLPFVFISSGFDGLFGGNSQSLFGDVISQHCMNICLGFPCNVSELDCKFTPNVRHICLGSNTHPPQSVLTVLMPTVMPSFSVAIWKQINSVLVSQMLQSTDATTTCGDLPFSFFLAITGASCGARLLLAFENQNKNVNRGQQCTD
jgi:hypothetical protein